MPAGVREKKIRLAQRRWVALAPIVRSARPEVADALARETGHPAPRASPRPALRPSPSRARRSHAILSVRDLAQRDFVHALGSRNVPWDGGADNGLCLSIGVRRLRLQRP